MRILVTGGAGFIGSHIVDALLASGHRVDVLDLIHPQVYPDRKIPAYFSKKANFIRGDIRNRKLVAALVPRADVIFHEASLVGVGQSMYEIEEYVDINTRGTSVLLDVLCRTRHRVRKLVVASSMSLYGEGAYRCPTCGPVPFQERRPADLRLGRYEPYCRRHRVTLRFVRTPETRPLNPTSIYASTKRDQEEMCLMIGRAYGIPTVALRYFNVYGPRQSLSNPYTGVLAIFGSRLLNSRPPLIFEDGRQSRDFVHVRDVAEANLAAMRSSKADGMALNVGAGIPRTVLEVAEGLAGALGKRIEPKVLKDFRVGDIRHCIADNRQIRALLGWTPTVSWESGLEEYVGHLRTQKALDRVDRAFRELSSQGLRRRVG